MANPFLNFSYSNTLIASKKKCTKYKCIEKKSTYYDIYPSNFKPSDFSNGTKYYTNYNYFSNLQTAKENAFNNNGDKWYIYRLKRGYKSNFRAKPMKQYRRQLLSNNKTSPKLLNFETPGGVNQIYLDNTNNYYCKNNIPMNTVTGNFKWVNRN